MTYSDRLIDKRVIERNIHKGLVDRKELDRHLQQLPDRTDNAEVMASESTEETRDGG